MPLFSRYIGIDYSGAETIESQLPGLRVYLATPSSEPVEIRPRTPGHKHWTRQTLAQWLADELLDSPPILVGIDHAFSFPIQYFRTHGVSPRWEDFIADFEAHWPTRRPNTYVDFIRDGACGRGAKRAGNSKWRRLCDIRSRGKSVFHFEAPGSVAKATHAGLPWLRYLRERIGEHLHFWPFDGWVPDEDQSVIAEVYPAFWKNLYPAENRNSHQQDAYSVARWMREADADDQLVKALHPPLPQEEKDLARTEGWILGLGPVPQDAPRKSKPAHPKNSKGKAGKPPQKTAGTSRERERIHEIANVFHGHLVTPRQLFFLEAFLGSLDDTLNEREVLSLLESMPPDFSDLPRDQLFLIEIDLNFNITRFPAPPFPHDPKEYCRLHPRR